MKPAAVVIALAAAVLAVRPPFALAAADRYGGVWHPGKGSGAFVPISAGMTYADLLSYKASWGAAGLRITDFEVAPRGCPSERDRFASQWENGTWSDKLYVVQSLADVQSALANECRLGYRLKDFEIWDTECDEPVTYVLLFRQDGKPCRYTPVLGSETWYKFSALVDSYNSFGYTLVDFEVEPGEPQHPTITGVWYYGPSTQRFDVLYRSAFETEMTAQEGSMTLSDMESFRRPEAGGPGPYFRRYVAGLWEALPNVNADDHEVGEVYGKFKDLIYMQSGQRQLVDFEVYPDTTDERFRRVFDFRLASTGGGYSYAILQKGELVAGDGEGYARQPVDGNVAMSIATRGAVASVTKFFTALGVLRYAETKPDLDVWLDQPMVNRLPPDFGPFGMGVSSVTIRDLLRQTTGLADFVPSQGANPAADAAGWRQEVIAWLSQPLANAMKPYNYQNVHFELLAIMMDEVELPPILNTATPWRDWMNQEVFASAGVGALSCGGTSSDALSYGLYSSSWSAGWADSTWDCAGFGTGVGMFWASSLELAKVSSAFRGGQIVAPSTAAMALAQGLGLDPAYPDDDGSPATIGDQLYKKGGALCGNGGGGDSVGTETLIARFDDYNFDDDPGSPAPPSTNDYLYEVGHRDFDVGIMIHSSPYFGACWTSRSFPSPKALLREAILEPEAW